MRAYIASFMLLISSNYQASEKLIPEALLTEWGFKTVSQTENSQTIKGLKKLEVTGDTVWYARYTLSKKCFLNSKKAKENLQYNRAYPSNGKDNFRGTFFAVKNCVFHIEPHADIIVYYDKSEIGKKFENYIINPLELTH